MEQKILSSALYSREAYEELLKYDIEESLSDQAKILWNTISDYYNKDYSAKFVDKDIIITTLERSYPKHGEMLGTVINSLTETSSPNILHEVIEQKKSAVKIRLSQAFASDKEDKVEPLLEEYHSLIAGELEASDDSEITIAPNITELLQQRGSEHRIKILPPELNDRLAGGPLRGHHIVIYALTEMGKTLFVLNMMRGFLDQGLKTLYIGNEDPQSDLIERFYVCVCGQSLETIRKNPEKAQAFVEAKGWENVVWAELAPGTIGDIRALIDEHKPDVLIVDQIRNLDTGEKNYVQGFQRAAQSMRNFAKKDNLLAISVTQAGDSANGKAILGRGDIDGSNVGIPGACDTMIGLGANQEQEFQGLRTISFAKNKIGGNKTPVNVFMNTKIMRIE